MTEKSKEDKIPDTVGRSGSSQNMPNTSGDRSVLLDRLTDRSALLDQLADEQARGAQVDGTVQQVSEQLATLLKSMTGSVAALQNTAVPSQQNHLLVLETQIAYLQRLAQDLIAVAGVEPTNESE